MCSNPVLVNNLPDVEILENFQCTSEEVWDSSSIITDDTIISTQHGQVVMSSSTTISSFLMSQKSVYIASTFWLNSCSQGRLGAINSCDFNKCEKFIFPIHCTGHWWCVMIDKSDKIYDEYDSLCRHRNSNYVFELLCNVFQMANIDLTSLR